MSPPALRSKGLTTTPLTPSLRQGRSGKSIHCREGSGRSRGRLQRGEVRAHRRRRGRRPSPGASATCPPGPHRCSPATKGHRRAHENQAMDDAGGGAGRRVTPAAKERRLGAPHRARAPRASPPQSEASGTPSTLVCPAPAQQQQPDGGGDGCIWPADEATLHTHAQ